jgi:hypothetical protein
VVAGCELDIPNVNMTTPPNATLAPNSTTAPNSGSTAPGPPGGIEPQPPGGGGTQPSGSPVEGQPTASPGGGTPPGSKQIEDDLSVPLPPYTLRFFLPIEKEAQMEKVRNDLFAPNRYPSSSDWLALESVTDVFVRNYVMETIGNGLNVVMDDMKTILLSKPGVQQVETVTQGEVNHPEGQSNEKSWDPARTPFESLDMIFESTAVLDATSPTLPLPDLLLKHVQGAFAGEYLESYLNMLQALQPSDTVVDGVGNVFASTTDVEWVPTPSEGTNISEDNSQNSKSSSISQFGPIFAAVAIVIVILIILILRIQFGIKCCPPAQESFQQTKKPAEFEQMFQSSASLERNEIDDGSSRCSSCTEIAANKSRIDDNNYNNSSWKGEAVGGKTSNSSPFSFGPWTLQE